MSDDLVKRLRDVAEATGPNEARQIVLDAADRIEELEAKMAKAVDALEAIKRYSGCGDSRRKAIETLAELKGEDRG